MDSLKVLLSKPSGVADGVSVWEWSGSALDEGDEASKWFKEYIGKPSRLVRFNAASETRPVDPGYARGHNIMFSDEYPFMLLSQESLDALNKLMKEPVPINRFRPKYLFFSFQAQNYISCASFTCPQRHSCSWLRTVFGRHMDENENRHKLVMSTCKVQVQECYLRSPFCISCKNVPTINQDTATAGPEPNETLMKVRSDKVLRPNDKQQGRIYFGLNLVCKESTEGNSKMVKVGDPIFVIQKVSSAAEAAA
ncbi:RING/U-box superfamily protein isoform 1 [Hibiscus syriacus]|uniref:RING/U-box superfamily protein isoform 1 n=1 Tax=Hibiscus syriacus TaxID=106335 RepID=A0A6A2Z542_HIBSY|nr:RING/U-box superfamily protein isoform 1 [Hibiscus syriacus]